ncbi:MAG: hypothetical protein KGI73_04655 [Patescibacteria group bacterium]|nr:hypothetical protein [Patescibacteria group bacterium]
MIGKLYFTRRGADRIRQEKDALIARLKETQGQKGEAAETGGNVWHDNFAFEDLCRQEMMLSRQIEKLNEDLARMAVVEAVPPNCDKVQIGHLLRLRVGEAATNVVVGGYGDSEPDATPPVVSYTAPLVRELMGKYAGAKATVRIGDEAKQILLERIEMPQKGGGS